MTSPPFSRRIFAAVCFMTVVPSVTWPSEAIATRPPWRTQTTVVECHSELFPSRAGYRSLARVTGPERSRAPRAPRAPPRRWRPPRPAGRRPVGDHDVRRNALALRRNGPRGPRSPAATARASSRRRASRRGAPPETMPAVSSPTIGPIACVRNFSASASPALAVPELTSSATGSFRYSGGTTRRARRARSRSSRRRSTVRAGTSSGCSGRSRRCWPARRASKPSIAPQPESSGRERAVSSRSSSRSTTASAVSALIPQSRT